MICAARGPTCDGFGMVDLVIRDVLFLVWDDLEKRALDEPESRTMITAALKG